MGRQERGHWGSDGYRELEMREGALNRDGKPIRNKELRNLKSQEYKNKKLDQRAAALLHPKGAGKRYKGDQ